VPSAIRVEEATEPLEGLAEAVRGLVGQLSRSASAPSDAEVEEIIRSPASRLLLARDASGVLVGMMTLAVFRIPTGVRAWVEDVVVDAGCRGQGIGAALIEAALELADGLGARTVDLTSRPGRDDANRLYRRLGFVQRETNVYRFEGRPPVR
jgi:ribosomal protein S18 acetylase RimI-like enzyme